MPQMVRSVLFCEYVRDENSLFFFRTRCWRKLSPA